MNKIKIECPSCCKECKSKCSKKDIDDLIYSENYKVHSTK